MTIRTLHLRSTTSVALLAAFGVLTGSPLLTISGSALVLAVVLSASQFYDEKRSRLRTWSVHAVTLLGLVGAVLTFPTSRIDSVLLILMLGVFNRFVLRVGHRDDLLIIGAACVLIAAATIITPGLGFAVIIFLFVPATLWSLWTSMLLGSAERRASSHHAAMLRRKVPPKMMRMAGAGLGLTIGGFAMVSVLPRFRFAPFLAAGAFAAMPGASDQMNLTAGGLSPREDRTVVLRVEPVENATLQDLGGLYARMYVLDKFDGKGWSRSERGHFRHDKKFVPENLDSLPKVHLDVVRTKRRGHQPVPVLGRERPSFSDDRRVHQDLSGTWVMDHWRGRTYGYFMWLGAEPSPVSLARGYAEVRDELTRALPDDLDPRITALATRLTAGAKTDDDKIQAVLGHFAKGYEYSLEALEGDADDPLVRFIFEAKKGHCELYAGAVAVLARAAGVPSRVATGYYNGVINDLGGFLAFAQQDAHAWVEVYIEGAGWRGVDATPADLRATRSATTWLTRIRDLYDAIDAAWYDYVVDFDSAQTRNLFMSLAWELHRGTLTPADILPLVRHAAGSGGGAVVMVMLFFGFFGVPAVLFSRRRDPEALGRRLRKAMGAGRDDNRTLGALLGEVPAAVKADATEVVKIYEALRFGGQSDRYAEAKARVRGFERAMKSAPT